MTTFLGAVALALVVLIFLYLHRVVRGPTVFDRLLALNGIGTKIIVLLVLTGALYGRTKMFVDISLGFGLLNLIGTLAASKFLDRKGL